MKKIVYVMVALMLACAGMGVVSAENNTTVINETLINETVLNETPLYNDSTFYNGTPITETIVNKEITINNGEIYASAEDVPEEYADYESWHKTENSSSYRQQLIDFANTPSVTRQQVADLLLDESKTEEQRHQEEYELMGLTDKLERFMNATKICVGDTWYVKFEDDGNFFTNLFGYNYQDCYEGQLAIQQYEANVANTWLGVQSRHLLHLEGY